VTLDATASTGAGALTCTWSFEDQSGETVWETATGCKITKTFQNADTKYVELTVTDGNGTTDANRQSFPVRAASSTPDTDVEAQAIWTVPTWARVGRAVTLDGTASRGDGDIACTWTVESRRGTVIETISGCRVAQTFDSAGTKYVRLRVRDQDGDTDTSRKSFTVR
jgi:hypothetical protein